MSTKEGQPALRKKSSFLDLFTRPRVERSRGARDAAPSPLPPVTEVPVRRTSTLRKPPPPPSEPGPDTRRHTSLYPPSLKTSKSSKSLRSVKRRDETYSARVEPHFEPPGLFKAYPQAVNHTTLEAPGSSHGNDDAETEAGDPETPPEQESPNSTRRVFDRLKARRRTKVLAQQAAARNASVPAWSKKIYILVTSGYLLQYSGSGPFDRLPEKLLKLGPNSAAFASDAIEGKHWVLQVVQDAKDGYFGHAASKTFLNRVGFQGRGKAVSSMLLVFASAGDMDGWMMVIRKEIAALGGVTPTNPEIDAEDKPDLDKSIPRRYSGIVRQPSVRSYEEPLSPLTPTTESTMIPSPRSSSVTAVNSPQRSSARSSRAVASALLSPVNEAHPQYTDESIASTIGPQLTSPSFFERQPSPSRFAFPQSPGQASFGSGSSRSNGPPMMPMDPMPNIPAHFVNVKPQPSRRRQSMQSNSSQNSTKAADQDVEQSQDLKQQYSSLSSHPVPVRVGQRNVDPSESEASSDAGGEASMMTWPAPPQPIRQGAFESMTRPSINHTSSMEPISESPPATPGGTQASAAARPGRRPAPLKLTTSALDSNTYIRRSSLATPGEPQSPRTAPPTMSSQSTVTGKRASVFHMPLPLKVSPPASNRVSVQAIHSMSSTSTTTSTTTTNSASSPCASPSAQYFTPPSTAGTTPMPTATLMSLDSKDSEKRFPRPTSLLQQDTLSPLPASTTTRTPSPSNRLSTLNNSNSYTTPTSKSATDLLRSTTANTATETTDRRTSISVPIVRPPMRSSLLRSRASANALGRALQLPPNPNPPPSSPLPPPPAPSSPPPAVPVAGAA